VYDAVGNVVARIDPVGRLTKFDYDQLVTVRQVDGAWPAAIIVTTTRGGTANEVQRVGYSASGAARRVQRRLSTWMHRRVDAAAKRSQSASHSANHARRVRTVNPAQKLD
jgi:uncharacterized protein RhaS with RHS repeats